MNFDGKPLEFAIPEIDKNIAEETLLRQSNKQKLYNDVKQIPVEEEFVEESDSAYSLNSLPEAA